MVRRTLLRHIAALAAAAVLWAQLAVAAYACPMLAPAAAAAASVDAGAPAPMPGCDQPMSALDPDAPNLCAEHCKQGQQSERASFGIAVPPALLSPLYEMPAAPDPAAAALQPGAWLSALVAASPPHAIAHCVLRI